VFHLLVTIIANSDILLGHFLLFQLLKDALLASASPSFNSRVIVVSSGAHRRGKINFDDLNFENTEYTPLGAYDQSKLANIHFANEVDRRYKSQNLRALSLHPGGILTPLTRYLPTTDDIKADKQLYNTLKDPAQGAATAVWGAVAKEWEGKGGVYLDEVSEGWLTPPDALYYHGGYAPQAFDPPTEKKLWDVSLKLTGLTE
jgi:NAD(P)-dependent dehydrogenase (short-subunit alcohol dehydrogenase family)